MSADDTPTHLINFVRMPSDPSVRLTAAQMSALFAGDREGFMREILSPHPQHTENEARERREAAYG